MPKKIEFRDLHGQHCKLLHTIWQVQTTTPQGGATAARVMKIAGFSKTEFNRYLHDLRKISKSFYILTVKGKKPVRYRLATEHLVTQSDTAAILILLKNYPNKYRKDGQIPTDRFVRSASKALQLPQAIVQNRIREAVEQHYLAEVLRDRAYLETSERLICEEPFLKLLAARHRKSAGRGNPAK